ncbi:ABC transporter substrate-binding protein [Actinoplanes sp. SE50]|uniref:LacI family DNA-binding transcriptional regulator n=1 Tax=unclassified Actinoplanes TaxID=2626549 RepID=UPI00023ED041|nr:MULTISPECIES: substrate-binding domain-containing protein [unclassified Actinoplanes]AEV83839.1 LacI family transcription regulator [Actinoplanes sp. SE50/110]ATO82017.1 ABC transporter substrate-binding protein [Actinoplanes sp. SE50]SLL99425.1 ABC transporter substrate-binding protein [Actinoplanes sp. SE50/110]
MAGGLIGLVLTGSAAQVGVEPFFMELIAGMEEALAPAGATVLLLVVPDRDAELATYRRWAQDHTVAAVVVVNLVHDDVRPDRVAALGLPAVLAGRHPGPYAKVVTDDAGAMTTAIAALTALGHRVIGRVSGPADLVHTAERTAAIRAAAAGRGVTVRIAEGDYTAEGGVRALRSLLASAPPPTAIVFDNDVMAVAAEQELLRTGTRVPAQVSLLACDDSPLCELAVPPLSALSTDVHEHGLTLGRAVLDVLDGGAGRTHPGPAVSIRHRESTGPAPAAPKVSW